MYNFKRMKRVKKLGSGYLTYITPKGEGFMKKKMHRNF